MTFTESWWGWEDKRPAQVGLVFWVHPHRECYLQELFEVSIVISLLLQQGCPVQLAAAKPDVSLHVGELGRHYVPDHLHRHLLTAGLLPHAQSPAGEPRC